MTAFWNVPYTGQVGTGANEHGNDCGPACVSIVLKWAGITSPSIDDLFNEVQPSGDSYTSFGDLMRLLDRHGVDADYDASVTTKDLFWILASGVPVIALIYYGALETIRPNKFKGNHFVTVRGMDLDTVYINDPLNTPASGENIAVPMAMFEWAWSTAIDCSRAVIVPVKPTVIPPSPNVIKTVYPSDYNGCSIRAVPGVTSTKPLYYVIYDPTFKSISSRMDIYEIKTVTRNGALEDWGRVHATAQRWVCLTFTVTV
jgi:predicted double-glycine peptidase